MDGAVEEAERIEIEAMRDMFAAADPNLGLHVADLGGAAAFASRAVTGILFNRVIGLGVFGPASRADVAQAVAAFSERGIGRYLVHLHPQARPARLCDWLAEQRLVSFRRSWAKFTRGADPIDEATTTGLRIEAIGPARAGDFARVACDGYGLPPAAAGLLAPLAGRPRWRVYVTYAGERVAGAAAMFVDGEAAWLGYGATEPEFRGRGSQRSLLTRRLRDGLAAGCRRFYGEVGETVPGEPQRSTHNILAVGFTRLCVRDNLWPASGRGTTIPPV